jgi:hypothetical protein
MFIFMKQIVICRQYRIVPHVNVEMHIKLYFYLLQ